VEQTAEFGDTKKKKKGYSSYHGYDVTSIGKGYRRIKVWQCLHLETSSPERVKIVSCFQGLLAAVNKGTAVLCLPTDAA